MKSSVKLLCVIRLIGRRVLPAIAIGMLVLGISFDDAQTLPSATSQVFIQAGKYSTSNAYFIGPDPVPLMGITAEDGQTWNNGESSYQAQAIINVSFGPKVPVVGSVSGDAQVNVSGSGAQAVASASGTLKFFFNIEKTGNGPFDPIQLPIYFWAAGQGEVVEGYGEFGAAAWVAGVSGVDWNNFKIGWSGGPKSDSFSQGVSFYLPPNDPSTPYLVYVIGNVYASNFSYLINTSASSQAAVSVDPIIRLDQETFDNIYGKNSFRLSDYYRLEFSPNLPVSTAVPEPSLMVLLGISVLSLAGLKRLWKE